LITCPCTCLPLLPGVLGKKTLILEKEEAIFKVDGCCSLDTRRPYGELGSVDNIHCCGFIGFTSNIFKIIPIFPGNGCSKGELVATIVSELKTRMKSRGDTGQITRAEDAMSEIKEVKTEVADMRNDLKRLMKHLNVPSDPPSSESISRI